MNLLIAESSILAADILIVDDLQLNISLLERILRNAGHTSIASTTKPQEVSALQRKFQYDLIILDIEMPELDGFQVMERLNETGATDSPPVLVITAAEAHKQRALQCGAKDFVSKPFEPLEVLTRVRNMLETRLLEERVRDHSEDNPALSNVIQKNIRKIIQVRLKALREQGFQDRVAHGITTFSGSMVFLYVHVLWFLAWVFANTGHFGVAPFDPYPYGLLTMVVSLEAIFLTTFVLISQNHLGREAGRLTDLGLQTGLLTEHELTRVLQMLRSIQGKLGITNDDDSNLADADLAMETRLEDVLSEIERLQRRDEGPDRRDRKAR